MAFKNTCIVLNNSQDYSNLGRTFIVFGIPRGGTTMVAGVINILGVDMGTNLPINSEDNDFNLDYLRSVNCQEPISHIVNTIRKETLK